MMWAAPNVTAQFLPAPGLTALGFGSTLFSLPYTVFAPVTFAGGNSSGAAFAGGAISPQLLGAAQANLAQQINQSIATVSNQGAWETSLVGGLFSTWGTTLGNIGQSNAAALTEAVHKSAKGCGGFLSCFFG